MKLYHLIICIFVGLFLVGCSGPTDSADTNATLPRLNRELDQAAQSARFQACMARLGHYRNTRVWVHGGAKPGVVRRGWDQLTDAEKSEVFDIAGCISTGGQVSEIMVTVAEEGNGPEIETRRVANDRDFAGEGK